jgi:hypothetical protein
MTNRQIKRGRPGAQAPQGVQQGSSREAPGPWQPIAPSAVRDPARQQRLQRAMQDVDRAFSIPKRTKTSLPHPDLGMTSFYQQSSVPAVGFTNANIQLQSEQARSSTTNSSLVRPTCSNEPLSSWKPSTNPGSCHYLQMTAGQSLHPPSQHLNAPLRRSDYP